MRARSRSASCSVPIAISLVLAITSTDVSANESSSESAPPVDLNAAYTGEVWANLNGGAKRGARYLDNLDLQLDIDGASAFGWPGVQLHAHMLFNNGREFSALVGDEQTVSNIETGVQSIRLFEAWAHVPLGGSGSLRFGLYDLNSEFDRTEAGSLFINSSHGIGAEFAASGENGPSIFPVTSLGLRIDHEVAPQLTVRAAILDAVPGDPYRPKQTTIKLSSREGALLVGEVEYRTGRTRIAAGHWTYSQRQQRINGAGDARSRGAYALIESRLAGQSDRHSQSLHGFLRAGLADPTTNPISVYFGAGLNWSQPFGLKTDHRLGLAVAWAEFGQPFRHRFSLEQREINIELTYRHALTEWLVIQPDIQLIMSPGGNPVQNDAVVAGLRISIDL